MKDDEKLPGRDRDSEEIRKAIAEHDNRLPEPTTRELGDMIRQYVQAETEAEKLEIELRAVKARKSKIARDWVVRRGSVGSVIAKGMTWSVQATRHGGFCFRRYLVNQGPVSIPADDLELPEAIGPRKGPAEQTQAPQARKRVAKGPQRLQRGAK